MESAGRAVVEGVLAVRPAEGPVLFIIGHVVSLYAEASAAPDLAEHLRAVAHA